MHTSLIKTKPLGDKGRSLQLPLFFGIRKEKKFPTELREEASNEYIDMLFLRNDDLGRQPLLPVRCAY